jgi:hypothetical protein
VNSDSGLVVSAYSSPHLQQQRQHQYSSSSTPAQQDESTDRFMDDLRWMVKERKNHHHRPQQQQTQDPSRPTSYHRTYFSYPAAVDERGRGVALRWEDIGPSTSLQPPPKTAALVSTAAAVSAAGVHDADADFYRLQKRQRSQQYAMAPQHFGASAGLGGTMTMEVPESNSASLLPLPPVKRHPYSSLMPPSRE